MDLWNDTDERTRGRAGLVVLGIFIAAAAASSLFWWALVAFFSLFAKGV